MELFSCPVLAIQCRAYQWGTLPRWLVVAFTC